MAIPKHIIEEVKHATRLSELLSGYVTLRRAGKEYQALCPFHQEKSPSFTISDEKGFYHCFGCGAHGDAISFLMNHTQLSYVEAIKQLAQSAGITIPEERPQDVAQQDYTDNLYEIMGLAAEWFTQQLHGEAGWQARQYIEGRGLKPDITQRFRLGFAPKGRTGLKQYMQQKGVSEQHMFDVGLLTKSDDGQTYDKFRSRLMFPILNASGRTIAFGGRLISDDEASRAPKYLNSPETVLFKKRSQFYVAPAPPGVNIRAASVFNKARDSERLLVVEGYMDVIAIVQAGIEEVVATLGTAFTEEHATMLWRAVDEPVLCLDGDSAGSRAMLRAAELAVPLLTAGKSLRFMLMPPGDDPDTLLKRDGRASFERLIQHALPLHEALFNIESESVDMSDPMKRARLEKTLGTIAARVNDPTTKAHLQRYFKEALWKHGRSVPKNQKSASQAAKSKPSNTKISTTSDPLQKLNQSVLKLLLLNPNLLQIATAEELLMRVANTSPQMDELKAAMQHFIEAQDTALPLQHFIHQAGLTQLSDKLIKDKTIIVPKIDPAEQQVGQHILQQWLDQLDQMSIQQEYQRLTNSIHSGDASQEMFERMMVLQQEIQRRKDSFS